MLNGSLVCEKIKDLNMTGHMLQTEGHWVVTLRLQRRKQRRKEILQTQISLKRQLKGGEVAHKAMAPQKLKDAGGEMCTHSSAG